jgi:hypothetical protein
MLVHLNSFRHSRSFALSLVECAAVDVSSYCQWFARCSARPRKREAPTWRFHGLRLESHPGEDVGETSNTPSIVNSSNAVSSTELIKFGAGTFPHPPHVRSNVRRQQAYAVRQRQLAECEKQRAKGPIRAGVREIVRGLPYGPIQFATTPLHPSSSETERQGPIPAPALMATRLTASAIKCRRVVGLRLSRRRA